MTTYKPYQFSKDHRKCIWRERVSEKNKIKLKLKIYGVFVVV